MPDPRVITYPGPPTRHTYGVGDTAIDSNGVVWYCSVAGDAKVGGAAVFIEGGSSSGQFAPMPSGTPTTGQAVTVSTPSPLALGYTSVAALSNSNPVAPAPTAAPGSATDSSRHDHVHPLGVYGRSALLGGVLPPGMSSNTDIVFDGVWNGHILNSSGAMGWLPNSNPINIASLSGSTYTNQGGVSPLWVGNSNPQIFVIGRSITLNSGIILQGVAAGRALILMASETITINGTLSTNGGAAAGAVAGTGTSNGSLGYYCGAAGGAGSTTNGGAGSTPASTYPSLGGHGGAAGAGGTGTAGAGGAPSFSGFDIGPRGLPWLWGYSSQFNSGNAESPGGGTGGGGGGGDGSNSGGGGGSGAGIILLIAPSIVIGAAAVLNAVGGAGAAGVAGNAGGGGGGGGGFVSMHGFSIVIASGAAINNGGGGGGAAIGTGAAGSSGLQGGALAASGNISDPSVANGGYGFGQGVLICQWQ